MSEQGKLAGHAFISYVREDSHRVDQLQRTLEAAGIPVWRDTASLWPGQDWRAIIRRAITDNALVFIACFSRNSVARAVSYQNEELVLAIEQLRLRRPDDPWLIPVRFDECDIPDRDLGGGRTLASIQRADLFGSKARDNTARLVAAIVRILEGGAEPSGRLGGWRRRHGLAAWLWRRWRVVVPAAMADAAVVAVVLTAVLAPGAGRPSKTTPTSRASDSLAAITGVRFSGSPGNYTVTIAGRGFGSPTVSLPYYGLLPNFRIADSARFGHGEMGYTGDSFPLAYEFWNDTKIVITGVAANSGDAITLAVWSNRTGDGASWGGNVSPVPGSYPVIKTVTFSGSKANSAVTIHGTGFGPAPVPMPFTGNLKYLVISDWRADPNGASSSGTWTTGVTEQFKSWTDRTIQISGFTGTFGLGPNVLHLQDPITIQVWAQRKYPAGPQTAWSGRFPSAIPQSAVRSLYIANSESNTVTPVSVGASKAGPAIPVGADPDSIAITPDGKTAYVGEGNYTPSPAVTPINIATNQAEPAILLPAGSYATIIAITPDGKTAYAASTYAGTVTPISTGTNKAGPAINISSGINAIAITPDSKTVYVASGNAPGTVTPIDTATNKAGPAIPVGTNPSALAITPDGTTVYVVNYGSKTVTPISTATNKAGPAIPVGTNPSAIAITPNGKTAYVTNEITLGTVTPINLATDRAEPAINVGDHPVAIVIAPDGKTAWALNLFSSTVTPISTAINAPGPPIYIVSGAYDIAITPDGETVYVINGAGPAGAITPINTSTDTAGPPIKVGSLPTAIAITPY